MIIGQTGSGKDCLRGLLEAHGWKFVVSYSTREPRYEGEDTHIFITKEEAKMIPDSDKVAVTFIQNGEKEADEYFATKQQVQEADAYIIDPHGAEVLVNNMPEEEFTIIYVKSTRKKSREMAIERAENKASASDIFNKRYGAENKQFTFFEQELVMHYGPLFSKSNVRSVISFPNHYIPDKMQRFAVALNNIKEIHEEL